MFVELDGDDQVMSSYVRRRWNVSTARRLYSIVDATPMVEFETIVWVWNPQTKDREELIYMESCGNSLALAVEMHTTICRKLALGISLYGDVEEGYTCH